jgi:hypothetical protein
MLTGNTGGEEIEDTVSYGNEYKSFPALIAPMQRQTSGAWIGY